MASNPDGYIINGTGNMSDALNSSEGPAAHLQLLQHGNIQSFFQLFSNFCCTDAGSFNQGSNVAYYNPMIQPQIIEPPPPVPLPAQEQGNTESISANSKQYNAILRRRQLRNMFPSPENLIATRQREIYRAQQMASNKRPRGGDGRFISMNQQGSGSSGDPSNNSIPQVDSSVEPTSSSFGCISSANKTDQPVIILIPEGSDGSGATTNTGTQCWQEKSNPENTASSTQCTALMPSDLAVLPPPKEEPDLEFSFLQDLSDFNLDDIEFDFTSIYAEPIADDASGSTTAPVAAEMVLPATMLRHRLTALKEYLIQNPAETFVKDVSTVQDILSGLANTELPTDTYLSLCEILSLMDMGTEYDAAKERQKKREKIIGLTQRLLENKSAVNSPFWCLQEEQKCLAQETLTKAILQHKIAGLEEEINKTKSQVASVSSSMVKRMVRTKKLQEECEREKERATALAAELNEQIKVMLGDGQADEELMGRPARVVEAAKQKIDLLLNENP